MGLARALEIAERAAEISVLAVDAAREGKRPMRRCGGGGVARADGDAGCGDDRGRQPRCARRAAERRAGWSAPLLALERAGIGPETRAALRVGGAALMTTALTDLLGVRVPVLNAPITPRAGRVAGWHGP